VRTERHGDVGLIVIDHPPVNAMSAPVRRDLEAAIAWLGSEPGIRAGVLACDGSTFVAGGDLREFDAPPLPPFLGDLCTALEDCPRPVVAAIHGRALGGGFELAIVCHARILAPDGRVGMPEARLGLIPGAGGTQRLPRLVGAVTALEMIAAGKQIGADEALKLGAVDEIATDVRAAAMARARALADCGQRPRVRDRALPPVDQAAFDAMAAGVRARARGALAPIAVIEAIGWALELPFDAALAKERARSLELRGGPQSRALRHLFHAERMATRLPAGEQNLRGWPVRHVGVVGGGTMGSGITVALVDAGLQVTLVEANPNAVLAAEKRVTAVFDRQAQAGRLGAAAHRERLQRVRYSSNLATLADSDLVIEAVIEEVPAKQAVFRNLSGIVRRDCVLASNTSYIDIDLMADMVDAPERVLGMHFFSPAHVMRLLEVVRAPRTSGETAATALAVAKRIGKQAVLCRSGEGFIGNRLLMRWRLVCDYALEDGALPHEVDAAMEAYGWAMGYFAVADLAGLDIGWAVRKRLAATRDPEARYVPIADWLCELGRFGQKTGAGYYRHEGGKRLVDPEVTALIERASAAKGITRRPVPAETIQTRVHAAMVNEAARALAEGIAQRPSDVDVVLVNGYGYPAWRGGPMHAADCLGVAEVLRTVEAMHAEYGAGWEPAPLLTEIVAAGKRFADLNVA
jgi:3-hydroxyacyl-CoA dehydrogenase